ncbi:prenyltransferase [Rhodobacteraceae bacterium CCMM004]|nr:prenyltransferase [Rhodobacteraceae bacterium CCMM004]
MADSRPLVVEAPALLATDLQWEAFWHRLGRDPLGALTGRGAARVPPLRADLLPIRPDGAAAVAAARRQGRAVHLAAPREGLPLAEVAEAQGLDARAVAARGRQGLVRSLAATFGAGAYEVLPAPARTWSASALIRALRPHQYVKNVLLFLPMIAAHAFDLATATWVVLGIVAFSAAASSIYVVNDLLDLEADRLHPTKRHRPFASGAVPIRVGMVAAAALALASLALGLWIGGDFALVLCGYMALSLAYSLRLKRMRWVDVFTLAALYTLRVVAGAAAGGVEASIFMLVFVFPVFLVLGIVKRLTELAKAEGTAPLPGRGYGRGDRDDLLNMAGLGTAGALVIFWLYIRSEQAAVLYPTEWILWLALLPIAVWLMRMIALGYYGRMDYDPIVFALRDRLGVGLLLIILSLMFYSAGLWAEWFG